jgi:hypothetical protein
MAGARITIAPEDTFASPSTTEARDIDISGLSTAYPLQVTRASWKQAAEAGRLSVRDMALTSFQGGNPPVVVDAAVKASGPVDSITGELELVLPGRGFGANDPDSTALGVILNSALSAEVRTPGTSFVGTYASANTMTHASGDDGEVEVGDIIVVKQTNATYRACKVTAYNSGTRTITTLEPHGIPAAGTATVRQCHMYFAPASTSPAGGSFVVEMSTPDELHSRRYVGCVMTRFAVRTTENGGIEYVIGIRAHDGERDTAPVLTAAAPLPLGVSGTTPLAARVAPLLVSQNHSASSAPYSGTASALPARSWSVSFEAALAPVADQGTRCRASDCEVADVRVTGEFIQSSPSTGVDWQTVTRLSRKHSAAFTAAGADAAGNGMGVWVGSVECQEDPGITFDEQDRTQVVSFRAGDYSGDDSTDIGKVNAAAILFFVA